MALHCKAILCLCFMSRYVNGFMPTRGSAILENDFTSEDIVRIALSDSKGEDLTVDGNHDYKVLKEKMFPHVEDDILLKEAVSEIVTSCNMAGRLREENPAWWFADEKIAEGHTLLLGLRDRLVATLSPEAPSYSAARETLGQILHLLLMFYSNTNWLELGHTDIYTHLGIPEKTMAPVAPTTMSTCIECGETVHLPCVNNTLTDQFLTSGYFGHLGQEETSADDSGHVLKVGKCRHGGISDSGINPNAVPGGINKQSESPDFSPHYFLHKNAASLAIQHVQFYLFNKEIGLHNLLGPEKFARLFVRGSDTSVFVDVQNDNIRDEITDHLRNAKLRVLDSTSLEIACVQAVDPIVVIRIIDDGTIYQEEQPLPCDTKRTRNVDIHIIPSNITDSRSKRALSGLDIYHLIADTSGGTVYETDKNNIAAVVDIIKESVSTKPPVTLMKFTQSSSSSNEFEIPIDNLVQNLTIKVQGSSSSVPTMNLYRPSGTQEHFSNKSVGTEQKLGRKLRVMKLFNPTPGKWKMKRMSTLNVDVIITASTDLDFSYQFMQPGPGGFGDYPLIGRPIAGENTTVQMSVPLVDKVGSVDSVLLLDRNGNTLFQYPLHNVGGRRGKTLFKTHITIPSKEFEIAVEGHDTSGNIFRRLDPIIISSLAIQLDVLPSSGTLYINQTITIPYRVRNVGGGSATIKVSITDDKGFARSPTSTSYSVPSKGSKNGSFVLVAGPTKGVTTTVTISAKASGAPSNKVQFNVRRVTVEEKIVRIIDTKAPVCNVTSTKGKCDFGADICECSKQSWEMIAIAGDDGDGLLDVFSSGAGKSSTFTTDPFSVGHTLAKGVVNTRLRADCCHQQAKITVVDVAGNVGLCEVVITPGFVPPDPKLCAMPTISKQSNTNANITTISCNITMLVDSCNASSECEDAFWSVEAVIGQEGYGRQQVAAVNAGRHANLTRTNQTVSLSMDCCHSDVYINVVDVAGHTGQCHAKSSLTTQDSGGGGSSNIAAVAGGAAGGVVVIGALAGLVYYLKTRAPAVKVGQDTNAVNSAN